jgi:N-acetylneuraminate lyase
LEKIDGLISAPFTPMNGDGSINYTLIPEYADFYRRNGIDGAFVCGTTGEGVSLTLKERTKIVEKWMESASGGLKIIVHVACTCMEDIKYLVSHARETGVFGIAALSPFFFKPGGVEELGDYCSEIAGAAPELPFYFYHMPSFTGVYLSMTSLLEIASARIPNFAGIKYTHGDLNELSQCIIAGKGKFDILYGQDETFLCGLVMGATGGVGGTYNHIVKLYREMKPAFLKGDIIKARELQLKSQGFIKILNKYQGNVRGGKRIMKLMGLDCGPNRNQGNLFAGGVEQQLKKDLEEIGFFDFCNK